MTGALLPTRLAIAMHVPDAVGSQQTGQLDAKAPAVNNVQAPDVHELDQFSQEQYNLNDSMALSLGYSLFSLSDNANHVLLVFQAARFKDLVSEGETYRFGVAIEAAITVTTNSFKGGLTLPVVAANVQLNFASASSEVSLRGYRPPPSSPPILPTWGSFDVSSYTDFQEAISKMQQNVLFDDNNIVPVLIATTSAPATVEAPAGSRKHWYNSLGIS
jgi:hypothetical protein